MKTMEEALGAVLSTLWLLELLTFIKDNFFDAIRQHIWENQSEIKKGLRCDWDLLLTFLCVHFMTC